MKICILAAGKGKRMGIYGESIHKALLPVGNKAVITRIIEQFDSKSEFIIAVGFRKQQIIDYIKSAHPNLNVSFVEVQNFDGPGSGPGQSLYECRDHLKAAFLFSACDTLIESALPPCDHNWIGIKRVKKIECWCSVKVNKKNRVKSLHYKENIDTNIAFVGIAFVKNYEAFWNGLKVDKSLLGDELQVNNGLNALLPLNLFVHEIEWIDTGNSEGYEKLLASYDKNYSFKGKITDVTYRIDGRIIKLFANKEITRKRYERALDYRNVFANVINNIGCLFSYSFEEGQLLSKRLNYATSKKFMEWAEDNLWKQVKVDEGVFNDAVRTFYYDKTKKRLREFCEKYLSDANEKVEYINNINCKTAENLIGMLNAHFFEDNCPSTYHGDLHADNIICKKNGFVLIDWRESFGPIIEAGDRYYDMAKYLHVLELSVNVMESKKYNILQSETGIQINHEMSYNQLEAIQAFYDHVSGYSYNLERIRIIDALVFINMAPLYEKNMAMYLYYLGRYMLQNLLSMKVANKYVN